MGAIIKGMRGIWVAFTLLIAAAGGGATGYYANLQYGPRTSLAPLHRLPAPPLVVSVRRITYVAAPVNRHEIRMSTPGIVDITPPEAMAALGLSPVKVSATTVANAPTP
jgi:hypothetical protein